MVSELGLSEECLAECRLKRARAERTFKGALEDIASRIDLKPEHLRTIKETDIVLASGALPRLEEMIGRLASGISADFEVGSAAADKLYEMRDWFKDGTFRYVCNGPVRKILVGSKGESLSDRRYLAGMTSEIAHSMVRSAGKFRGDGHLELHPGVSECYDLVFSCSKRQPPKYTAVGTMLSHYFLKYEEAFREDPDRCIKSLAVREGDGALRALSPRLIRNSFEELSRYGNRNHLQGRSIGWQLLCKVKERMGCASSDALDALPGVLGKAMYDDSVDFSSPDAFVESVTARLDDYLAE